MGLWSKGIERSQTGEIRLGEIHVPDDLLKEIYSNTYTVNTITLCKMFKEFPKTRKLDMSRHQFIWWGKFMYRSLLETNFVITDPTSEIYLVGGNRCSKLLISKYDTNIITERYNVKSNFIQTIKNIGRTGGYNCVNLDGKDFSNLKHIVRYMSNFIEPKSNCKDLFYEWLNNEIRCEKHSQDI